MKKFLFITTILLISTNLIASNVTLDVNVINNDNKPMIMVKTNLPQKTMLTAVIVNPINQGGDGYVGQVSATVSPDKTIKFGPFTKNGNRLSDGTYNATITTIIVTLQPKEIQPFFGTDGEKLTGNNISNLAGQKVVYQTFKFEINSSKK